MTNRKALQLLRKHGFSTETTADGHVLVRDEAGMIIGKMRQTGEAHISLQKFIAAGFPTRRPSIDRYMKLLVPGAAEELLFWCDD
jgi:hypothetical protein